jgi:hypothetical protein
VTVSPYARLANLTGTSPHDCGEQLRPNGFLTVHPRVGREWSAIDSLTSMIVWLPNRTEAELSTAVHATQVVRPHAMNAQQHAHEVDQSSKVCKSDTHTRNQGSNGCPAQVISESPQATPSVLSTVPSLATPTSLPPLLMPPPTRPSTGRASPCLCRVTSVPDPKNERD